MGRSKKNWDHLVDYRGNYGINVEEGYFPGSPNRPGIKGNKGEVGFKGQKGQDGSGGATGAKGAVGPKGEPGPHSIGPKGEKGEAAGLFLFQGVVSGTDQLPLFNQNRDTHTTSRVKINCMSGMELSGFHCKMFLHRSKVTKATKEHKVLK